MKFKKIVAMSMLAVLSLTIKPLFASSTDLQEKVTVVEDVVICDCGIPYAQHIEHIEKLEESNSISARALSCDCGGSLSVKTVYDGAWYRSSESRTCIHYAYGHDYKWIKPAVTRYKCNSCALEFETYSTSRTEWRCGE